MRSSRADVVLERGKLILFDDHEINSVFLSLKKIIKNWIVEFTVIYAECFRYYDKAPKIKNFFGNHN